MEKKADITSPNLLRHNTTITPQSLRNEPGEISRLVSDRVEAERAQFESTETHNIGPFQFKSEEILKALDSNEDGDASLFIELHRGRFVYDHAAGVWFEWAGHYWKEDTIDRATEALTGVIDLYATEAGRQQWERLKAEKAGDANKAKKHEAVEDALLKRIRALQTKGRKENVLFLARTGAASLGISGDEWGCDPWLLCCLNGVIDLRTGGHRPGRPDDFIKTIAPVEWKGINEPTLTWGKFLTEIFADDRELISYVRRLFGYSTSGRTTEHISPILWGKGRNGKGTLLETLGFVLGNYAGPAEPELILKQKFTKRSGGPTSDIMNLRGKRLVWGSETDEGRNLNAGKLKWLSGGDTLTGREMYGRHQVSFRPSHKFFLLTNHKPHAAADDYALWQRINLIPFTQSFVNDPKLPEERKADPTLPDKLKGEASGILAWLVRGCLEWQAEGLKPPYTVKAATEEYRQEEDTLPAFISECCETGLNLEVQAGKLYSRFKEWCENTGIKAISGVAFGKQIKDRFGSYENRNRTFYVGLSISKDSEC